MRALGRKKLLNLYSLNQTVYQAKVDFYSRNVSEYGKNQQMMSKAADTQRTKKPELPDCVSDLEQANKFSE